jgi:hypothetical protein
VNLPFVKNIPRHFKGCRNLARRKAISNLPVALKIWCKAQRTEILPHHGIENIPNIEHGKV